MRQRGDGDWRVRKIKGGVESGAKGGGGGWWRVRQGMESEATLSITPLPAA